MHKLSNCETRDTISIDQWFDRTGNVHSHTTKHHTKSMNKQWIVTQISVCPVPKQAAGADY